MSIRSARRARPLPTEAVTFPTDPAEWAAAHERHADAAAAAAAAAQRDPHGVAPAHLETAERAAQHAIAELGTEEFVVHAIAPEDWETLLAEHPPAEGNAQHQELGYNPAGFYPAVLAETVTFTTPEGPVRSSAEEWAEMLSGSEASFTAGQRNVLINAAQRLNTHAVVVAAVGKD